VEDGHRPLTRKGSDLSFLFQPSRVWIMGVLNLTPDSFYASSRAQTLEKAIAQAILLKEEGADVLDLGGESTRPGSQEVPAATEADRVLPLVRALQAETPGLPLSIDTRKAAVARAALDAGASMINDISALRHDPEMAGVLTEAGVPVVLMHMQGTPETMQNQPTYRDVVSDIRAFFEERLKAATRAGISEDRIILDPGIGFGKTLEHNVEILKRLSELKSLGRPLLVGVSRKTFIGRLLAQSPEGIVPPEERLEGTLAANLRAVERGASGLRVHDVAATKKALRLWQSLS